MDKYIDDPITNKKYKVKDIIKKEHYTINIIYNNDDINFTKLNQSMSDLLYNQAIVNA